MSIPSYKELMKPILKLASDEQVQSITNVVKLLEKHFNLTDEEKQKRLLSGQRVIYNRTTWAITYLNKAGLIGLCEKRGTYKITKEGQSLLAEEPQVIDFEVLRRYESYCDFVGNSLSSGKSLEPTIIKEGGEDTPEELIVKFSNQLNIKLVDDILDEILKNTPYFFERLIVDLLLKMGYGGLEGSGEVTKKTADGGIDGIIRRDELGFDVIYVQAKRWNKSSSVSKSDIQAFVGALSGKGVTNGVFITTSNFNKNSLEYVEKLRDYKVILIDGLMLAQLMIKYDLGVSTESIIHIKKIDSDYFEEQ